nr:hypothetical protein [Tanacetum cinerariifolium]
MKSKRVKRHAKKSTKAPTRGVVIRETPEMPLSKKNGKVDVARGKGIELLSDVALTKEAQYKEVQRKSMRDFHTTHPSRSDTVTKTGPSVAKINPSVTNEGIGVKPGVLDENKEEDEDDDEEGDELVKTPSNDSDDEEKITDKAEGYEDKEMDYTTSQLYDDVDIRPNEPVDTNKGFIQEEGIDAEITNVQQGYENPKITQVTEDAHVTLSTIQQKTEVPFTSSSHSSDLASKLLNFSDIPHTDAEIVSPMDVHVHHEIPNQQTPTLLKVLVLVIIDSSPIYSIVIPQSLPSFNPPPQQSTSTPPPTTEAINTQSTLFNFAFAVLANESSQPQSSYEAAATLIEFKLKKILIDKMDKSESYLEAPEHKECYKGLIKSYDLDKIIFSTYGKVYSLKRNQKDKDKDEDPSAGSDRGLKKKKTSKDAEPIKEKMSRDVLTVGSTMRIPLLYRGVYSQWVERFMNYLEEQTDGEEMINSIKNGDQPLPRVTQVYIAGTSSTEQPPLKEKSMWSDQEKRIQKIDRLARSLQIQGLSKDIYSLIDSNKTAKDL